MLVFTMQASKLQKRSILQSLHSEAKTIADAIKFFTEDYMIVDDELNILEFTYDYIQGNSQIKELIISKTKGKAIFISQQNWSIEVLNDSMFKHHESKGISYRLIYDKQLKEEVFHFSYPVKINTFDWGWIHISLSLKQYNKEIKQMYKEFFYLALLLGFVAIIIFYFLAKRFSIPIVQLNLASNEIINGNLANRLKIDSDNEIGTFAQTFNKMLDKLEESQEEKRKAYENLEHTVALRTKELKNVNSELENKTDELKILNKNLKEEVKLEVEKQQHQKQLLIQQSKLAAMGEMIGNIAHQWRQPLNALGLVIQNINLTYQMDELDNVFMNKSVNKANVLTNTMSKTIDDFRDFFNPSKTKQSFSVQEAVEKSLFLIESSFLQQKIKIITDFHDIQKVYGVQSEFSQALLNILTNARDALFINKIKTPEVKISISATTSNALLRIEDNAGGIKENIMKDIFNPYFTTKEENNGTGIGLYMSKVIIEQNLKGEISVENTNGGVAFIIKIPIFKEKILISY